MLETWSIASANGTLDAINEINWVVSFVEGDKNVTIGGLIGDLDLPVDTTEQALIDLAKSSIGAAELEKMRGQVSKDMEEKVIHIDNSIDFSGMMCPKYAVIRQVTLDGKLDAYNQALSSASVEAQEYCSNMEAVSLKSPYLKEVLLASGYDKSGIRSLFEAATKYF